MPPSPKTAQPKKTPEQLAREAANAAAVQVVSAGFEAIDELAEIAKRSVKKMLIEAISGKRIRR